MPALANISRSLARLCEFVGGVSLVIIILVTIADVITRYLFKLTGGEFGFTIKGTVEVVSYMMFFALISAFAAYVERSQVIVDVFTQKMPQNIKGYMMGVFMIGFFLLGIIFVWGLYDSAVDAAKFGKTTQDLRVSMTPIFAIGSFLSGILAIRSLIEAIHIFKTGEFYDAEETGS